MTTKVMLRLCEIEAGFEEALRAQGFPKIVEVEQWDNAYRSFKLATVFCPVTDNEPAEWFVQAAEKFLGHKFVGAPSGPLNGFNIVMAITVEGGPGGDMTLTGLRWADGTLATNDIFAAIDKMSSDEMFAEAVAHVKEAILNGNCLDIDCLDPDEAEELAAEALHEFVEDNRCGVRCYVAMIRCRDRAVAEKDNRGACGCFKSIWPACPSCGDGPDTDPCFVCQEWDCGPGHGDMRIV